MKISYSWLKELVGKDLPKPKELADLLTMHSFETEVAENDVLEVDVLPNRAHDCLSHLGIAREINAILGFTFKEKDFKLKEKGNIKDYLTVKVEDKDLCLRYTGRVLKDVKIQDSSKQIQERLIACGLRPINNIVDITNYVMLKTGQPMHAFDFDKLSGGNKKSIVVRRAKHGESITILDGEAYNLDKDALLIADSENPLCIAGIKGGKSPEIDKNTENIILEAANFSSQSIRKTSLKLKLRTDASLRFEHCLDPNLTEQAIDMAAYLIQDSACGQVVGGLADVYSKKIKPIKIKLEVSKIKSLLGIDISNKEIKNILLRLGFGVKDSNSSFQVEVPTRRIDVVLQEDLIEEIGRLYGYENIIGRFPNAALIPSKINGDLVYQNKVRDILSGFGFDEVYNYSFVGDKELEIYSKKNNIIEMANPISQDQKYLRPNLIFNLLGNIKKNKKYFEEFRIFEIGRVFYNDKISPKENQKLGAVVFSDKKDQNFYNLKGVIDSLLNKLGITDQWYDDELESDTLVPDFCHSGRRAEIKVGDDYLGWIGEIDKNIIDSKVSAFELDFDKLLELATEERIYLTPSKYPAMARDIAVFVNSGTKVAEVLNLINVAGGELVRDVDLFDIYEDENSSERMKSIAFHIIYQSNERNLTDKDVNKVHDKIIKTLEQEGGWEVRK
ncbi:phenylalanine--tRNA ligase subunit beta [Patescibacteria group bacterium]